MQRVKPMKRNRTPEEKIRACKALQGKTVADICQMPGFLANLSAYVEVQRAEWKKLREFAESQPGKRAKAHPMDTTIGWTDEQWRYEFMAVLNKTSHQSSAVREYIRQLGMQAYNVTVANLVILEFPDLRSYFFKNSKVV